MDNDEGKEEIKLAGNGKGEIINYHRWNGILVGGSFFREAY